MAAMEAVLADGFMSMLDPFIPNLPWKMENYKSTKRLRVGWFEQDDFFPVTAGCKRAIKIAKDILKERGHELVSFSPPSFEKFYEFGCDILMSEGGGAMLKLWEGEILDDSIKLNKKLISAPSFVKTIMEYYLRIWSPRLSKLASRKILYANFFYLYYL